MQNLKPIDQNLSLMNPQQREKWLNSPNHHILEWEYDKIPYISMDVLEPIMKNIYFAYKEYQISYKKKFVLDENATQQEIKNYNQLMDSRIRFRILDTVGGAKRLFEDKNRRRLFLFLTNHETTDSQKQFILYSTHLAREYEKGQDLENLDRLFQESAKQYFEQTKDFKKPEPKKTKKQTPEQRKIEKKQRKKECKETKETSISSNL